MLKKIGICVVNDCEILFAILQTFGEDQFLLRENQFLL